MTHNDTPAARPMFAHAFLPGTTVNLREHRLQVRALRAGVTDLIGYQLFRRGARHYTAN